MQDHPPQNRAERRAASRKAKPALVRPFRQPQNKPQEQAIGTGATSASDDLEAETATQGINFPFGLASDTPPTDRKVSHKAGGTKQQRIWETLVSYYALAGMGVSRFDMADGALIVSNAHKFADAWVAAGKANPSIQHALEVITVAGPYTALISIHVGVVFAIMDNHGANPFAGLLTRAPVQSAPASSPQAGPAPLPYVPVGASAPTDNTPPPTYQGDESGFLVIPDEGLPAELDVALRQMAMQSGRPYEELRQEALVELAQMRMGQNGHTVQPGTLGAPVGRQ